MERSGRRPRASDVATGAWAGLTLAHFVFHTEVLQHFWLALAGLFLIPIGLGCAAWTLLVAVRSPRHRLLRVALAVAVLVLGYVGWCSPLGHSLGIRSRLYRDEEQYAALVERVLAGERQALRPDVRVDEGPPVRVAFDLGWHQDNWDAIVFDPTGAVLDVAQWGYESHRLFGWGLIASRHLRDDWYYCIFG